jgi:hypothetical protein
MPRSSRSVALIIGGVALLAAALLLWVIVESGDDGGAASARPVAGAPADPAAAPQAVAARPGERQPGGPQVVASEQDRRGGEARAPTETVVDGVRIRDHRRDRSKPIEVLPRPPPEHARQIPRSLTAELSNRILPLVRECVASVPAEARGPRPRVAGEMIVAIKDQQVQVTRTAIEVADLAGASADAAKRCIEQKALGVTAPAADEADLTDYSIRISFSL